jgi:hypothetical protein
MVKKGHPSPIRTHQKNGIPVVFPESPPSSDPHSDVFFCKKNPSLKRPFFFKTAFLSATLFLSLGFSFSAQSALEESPHDDGRTAVLHHVLQETQQANLTPHEQLSTLQRNLRSQLYTLDSEVDVVDMTAPQGAGRSRRESVRTFDAAVFVKQTPFKFFSGTVREHITPFIKWISLESATELDLLDQETIVETLKGVYHAAAFEEGPLTQERSKEFFPQLSRPGDLVIACAHLKTIHSDIETFLRDSARLFFEYQNPGGKKKEKERLRNRAASGLGLSKATLRHVAGLDTSWEEWAKTNLILPLLAPHIELELLKEVTSLLERT